MRIKFFKGFSLIELLTVIAIIGILAAIATGITLQQIDKARYADAALQMHQIAESVQIFRLERGYYPDDVEPNIDPDPAIWFPINPPAKIPFDSWYDYDNYTGVESGVCVHWQQVVFYGRDRLRSADWMHLQAKSGEILRVQQNLVLLINVERCDK